MEFVESLKKAMAENRCIALPKDDMCADDGNYLIKLRPYQNYFDCLEFYGTVRFWNGYPVNPGYILRNDWEVSD